MFEENTNLTKDNTRYFGIFFSLVTFFSKAKMRYQRQSEKSKLISKSFYIRDLESEGMNFQLFFRNLIYFHHFHSDLISQ